ncbi:breast cancer anti-estrogen resistance protein 3 homolog [Caerostris darwini]|uniref:Breast cancer anti-estrogen resistance protein 3 homolog n=1 Tax=Caerostris darwini TaxID=1538125 RepID=A0AAV4MQA6_9ARAC|nr:breast cancer anti-estrogen resistance protein 3 homolog [Caerostris darwini]
MASQQPHLSIDLWLEKLDMNVYKSVFEDYNGVEDILWMTERDLKNLGIKNGSHRARLATSLTILKDKYLKTSREGRNTLSPNDRSPHSERSRSNISMSPIHQIHFEENQTGVRSWPSTRPSTNHATKHSSPRSSTENFVGTDATAEDLKRALEKELSLDSSDLRSYAWYHGTILRQRAEELVSIDGNFLVRDCISQPGDFVITCKWNDVPLHFIIKKVILNPDTVYERFQYCFEKESFDSIPDFITYYVGSKCPLSEASGVIISCPVNRIMPLSYYASRYGIQCQIHYVAKALEKIPSSPDHQNNNTVPLAPVMEINQVDTLNSRWPQQSFENKRNVSNNKTTETNNKIKLPPHQNSNLIKMGSDPMLSPNTERRSFERRPNSGLFNTETLTPVSVAIEDKPPPKPSRVPSKKCAQRPLVVKKERKLSEVDDNDIGSPNFIPVPGISLAHSHFERQISETRFSFLDRPSVSSCSSTPDAESVIQYFTMPKICDRSVFKPQQFQTPLLATENSPLEGSVLSKLRQIFLCATPKTIASHLTRMDLELAKHFGNVDLGLGVNSGLELFLLPQGEQMQKDLLERTKCIKLFVAVLILTCPDEEERMKILNRWIEVAIETKTSLGNFYGFTSIMLGLTLPEILGLHSVWLALRRFHTETAFMFETRLRPTFKSLQNGSGLEAPNTCLPYILSLILILQQHISVMNAMEKSVDNVSNDISNFILPGNSSTSDFGLQLLADHLETGRNILQQIPVFKKNGEMSLQSLKYQDILLDVFNTEFHLRMLWGYRGCDVCSEQRHTIFQKVVHSLYNKCTAVNN